MASGRKEVHQDAPTPPPLRSWGGLLRRIRAPCKTSVGGSGRKGGYTNKGNSKEHIASSHLPPDKRPGLAHPRWGPTIADTVRSRLPQRVRANKAGPEVRILCPGQQAPAEERRGPNNRAPAGAQASKPTATLKKGTEEPILFGGGGGSRADPTHVPLATHIGLWFRITTGQTQEHRPWQR